MKSPKLILSSVATREGAIVSLLDPTPLIMNTAHSTERKGSKCSFTPTLTPLLCYLKASSGGQSVTPGSAADALHRAVSQAGREALQ